MRSHVHCIQAAKVVTGTSYCSRVLAWTIDRWCCSLWLGCSRPSGDGCPDSAQRSCRSSQKNGSRKTGISAVLMSGSSLIFCNHGRVMGRFALHDWEPMVLEFWWGKYFFSFSDFSVSFLCRVLIKAMWCGVFSSAVVGCLVVLWRWQHARCLWMKRIYRWTQVKLTRGSITWLVCGMRCSPYYHLTL